MGREPLDTVDEGILYLLQENARSHTTAEIGEKLGVSSSTVANRINALEERGVITGYHPTIDYEKADIDHHLYISGSVSVEDQSAIVDDIVDVRGVVGVRELLTSVGNVSIELVCRDRTEVREAISKLHSVGVTIEAMDMIGRELIQPYDHYGEEFTTGTDGG